MFIIFALLNVEHCDYKLMGANKELQEERVRRYFLEAAKEIIKGEGIEALSVRSVAERAGYSYGTMYNYFQDIRVLLTNAVQEFLDEAKDYALNENREPKADNETIFAKGKGLIKYFLQYPAIFELAFCQKLPAPANFDEYGKMTDQLFEDLFGENFKKAANYDARKEIVHHRVLVGILSEYLLRKYPVKIDALFDEYCDLVDFIMG